MRVLRKTMAVVLAGAMIAGAVPAQAAVQPKLDATKNITAGKKGRAMTAASVKKYQQAGYTLKFASSKTAVATVDATTGVIKAIKAGSKTNITCKFVKTGKATVTKKMKLTVVPEVKLAATKNITAGKKGRTMTAADVKAFQNVGYTLTFTSSKPAVATVDDETGIIQAIKAGSKTNIHCKFVKTGKKTVTKMMKLTVKAPQETAFSVTQTGAKEFTITGEGLSADTIKVTKGSSEVTTETPVISADATMAVVTTSGKLTEATYTVTAGDKSADVVCTVSEPTTVELSDKICATEKILNYTQQYDGQFIYVVRNQWGEDVTKTVSPTINVNGVSATYKQNPNGDGYIATAAGVIYPQTMTIGTATITVNIFDTSYPKINTNKALVVSDMATAKAITFTEIYNVDGDPLVARADGVFVYLFDLETVDGVKIIDTQDSIIKDGNINIYVNPGMTNLDTEYDSADIIQVEKADGTVSLGVELKVAAGKELAAGTGTITMMDLTSGVQGTGNIEVGDGTVVKTFSAAPEDTVVMGEDAEFSFTATDAAGNAVTDLASLKAVLETSNAKGFRFQKEGTAVKLYYNSDSAGVSTTGPQYATFTTENYTSTVSVSFNLMAAARPATITGIRDAAKGALLGKSVEYGLKNIILEDQYGRTMSKATAAAKMKSNDDNKDGYKIVVANESTSANAAVLSGDTINNTTSLTVTAGAGGSATNKLSLKLVNADGTDITFASTNDQYDRKQSNVTNNSEYTMNFLGASESSITSYAVDCPDMLYYNGASLGSAYTAEVEVYGKVGSVEVAVEDFDITFEEADDLINGSASSGIKAENGKITGIIPTDGTWRNSTDSTNITSAKRVMEVNINGSNPQTITREITLSAAAPVAKSAYFIDTNGNEVSYKEITGDTLNAVLADVYVVDQYGVDTGDDEYVAGTSAVDLTSAKLTVSEIDAAGSSASVASNGTYNAALKNFQSGDTFTLKITFQGGFVKTVSCSYK